MERMLKTTDWGRPQLGLHAWDTPGVNARDIPGFGEVGAERRVGHFSFFEIKFGVLRRSQSIDATIPARTSHGFIHPRVCRGRPFSWRATAAR